MTRARLVQQQASARIARLDHHRVARGRARHVRCARRRRPYLHKPSAVRRQRAHLGRSRGRSWRDHHHAARQHGPLVAAQHRRGRGSADGGGSGPWERAVRPVEAHAPVERGAVRRANSSGGCPGKGRGSGQPIHGPPEPPMTSKQLIRRRQESEAQRGRAALLVQSCDSLADRFQQAKTADGQPQFLQIVAKPTGLLAGNPASRSRS